MKRSLFFGTALAACLACQPRARADEQPLEQIVISASLRATALGDLPQSASVLDAGVIEAAGVQHFEDVLALVPGLNWAGGSSRPRYFQLRGVGETEQYQGAPNPSVGFLIDDVDFSGVGMPATLFDLDRIEVLRGPSGTVYGANALAGLISVRSRDPGTHFDLHAEATAADYGTEALGLAVGDGRSDGSAGWRLAAQRYRSDGFRHNVFLGRRDTNGYDETTLRGKLSWRPSQRLQLALTLLHADLDNGYDAWSIDNSYTTRSNQPGRDAQRSSGAALRLHYQAESGEFLAVSSAADSNIDYSYDGDWGNDAFWGVYAPYDYFEQHLRVRRTVAQDLRFIGNDAHLLFGRLRPVAGVYLLRLREGDALFDSGGGAQSTLTSSYAATNAALYGSLDAALTPRASLQLGLRYERRVADYTDSTDGALPVARDGMQGGNLSWSWRPDRSRQYYATLARGYKGGGFNIGTLVDAAQRRFAAESLWNLELGLRGTQLARGLELQGDVYYMRRQHMQVYTSQQVTPDNPLTYVYFTQNAARGENLGLESELRWQATVRWQFSASAALQRTRFLDYNLSGAPLDAAALDGRAQPFAPAYQLSLAGEYRLPSGWYGRVDGQALAGFYFSAGHDQRAAARQLVNLRVGYHRGHWNASLWARNLFDRRYAVEGFYFGLEPPDFAPRLYLQNGDPRQIGFTTTVDFGGADHD